MMVFNSNKRTLSQIAENGASLLRGFAKILFLSTVIWILGRVFFFQIMQVPSASMRGTLMEGDYIVVNKIGFGARLPLTPLSLPFGNSPAYLDWLKIPYFRIPGFVSIKRNDILVFNFPQEDNLPIDMRIPYVKRCVGVPGDTLLIADQQVFINGKKSGNAPGLELNYMVTTPPKQGADSSLIKIVGANLISTEDHRHFQIRATENDIDWLMSFGFISFSERCKENKKDYSPVFFPNNGLFRWNLDNFGPLYIPQKGAVLLLTAANLPLYQMVIEKYEGNLIETKGDSIFLNHHYSQTYTFHQNYYFTLGDNRHDSKDSRYWGFLPENHIIGTTSCVLFSGPESGFLSRKQISH
jgi:signal peptidase I